MRFKSRRKAFCSVLPLLMFQHQICLRLPDVLERHGLSLNFLSKRVMSLILEKHLVVLEYFPASLEILEYFQIVHLRTIDYVEHSSTKKKNVNEQSNAQICSILNSCVIKSRWLKKGCVVILRFVIFQFRTWLTQPDLHLHIRGSSFLKVHRRSGAQRGGGRWGDGPVHPKQETAKIKMP